MHNSLKSHWKDDLIAGFIVFLIALPLSIGIALAAGAPASAGILSAIIGGIIGTLITGTHITISGPAAGLIVVIGGSITSLADGGDLMLGFKRTLAATIIAGALQIVMGLFRLGKLTFLAPSSVVHGMLAAIGTIIMIKQIPILLGVKNTATSILGVVWNIPDMIGTVDLPIFFIALVALAILIMWMALPKNISKIIPGPLVAVLSGLLLSRAFDVSIPHDVNWLNYKYHIGPEFLVHVPDSVKELFIWPKFDIILSTRSLISIMTIFLVGSLESLLSAYAVDKLDPYKRKTNMDYDLIGKGITNMTCGALGAYPIITEIVRSSANITNGAKTKWSNFFHGVFILVFVAFFPQIINNIPLASLAAVLFLVGFNLAHPKHFIEVYHHGKEQLVYFCATLIVTLVEDLLIGIAAGIALKVLHHLFIEKIKINQFFSPLIEVVENDSTATINIKSPIVFLGFLKLDSILKGLNKDKEVIINENDHFLDFTIKETLKDFFSQRNSQSENIDEVK
jgi:MFS superfamily sulfate permease-like transporter